MSSGRPATGRQDLVLNPLFSRPLPLQRSGETLGILQKVRTDTERLITQAVNTLFFTLVGILFVMVYAFTVHWAIVPFFLLTIPLLGLLSSVLSRRIKKVQ